MSMPEYDKVTSQGALSNAERQARYRARRLAAEGAPVIRIRRAVDRRSRPQRWRAAVAELLALQEEYIAWLDGLPASLHGSATAEALQAVADLDLEALAAIEPPRGYGRD
jgi:hypothetical protein